MINTSKYVFLLQVIFHVIISKESNRIEPKSMDYHEDKIKKSRRRVIVVAQILYLLILVFFLIGYAIDVRVNS